MSLSALGLARLTMVCGIALGVAGLTESRALESRTYVISVTPGHGPKDCLGDGGECGREVADAWCKSYGQGVGAELGRSDDDSSAASKAPWPAPKRYLVVCSSDSPGR